MPKSELLKIRNFGQKSLDELYEKLAEKNYLPEEEPEGEGESADGSDRPDGGDSPEAVAVGDDAEGTGDDSSEA
jgi:hypothetical protein